MKYNTISELAAAISTNEAASKKFTVGLQAFERMYNYSKAVKSSEAFKQYFRSNGLQDYDFELELSEKDFINKQWYQVYQLLDVELQLNYKISIAMIFGRGEQIGKLLPRYLLGQDAMLSLFNKALSDLEGEAQA